MTDGALELLALEERAERLARIATQWSRSTGRPVRLYLDRVSRVRKCRFLRIANMAKKLLIEKIENELFAASFPPPAY